MKKEEKLTERINRLENSLGKFTVEVEPPKKNKKKTPTFFTSEVAVLLIIATVVSLVLGGVVTYKMFSNKQNDKYIEEFIENYNYITDNYYEEIDKEKLIDNAIEGMMSSLDANSLYLDEDDSDTFNKTLNGGYKGFGMGIYNDEDGQIIIADIYKNSPADKAGLKPGDIITKLNGKDLEGYTSKKFVSKTENMKEITINYRRDNAEKEVTLKKDEVTLPSVSSQMLSDDIGYMYISIFAANTAQQVEDNLKKLDKAKKLIIDLRGNSGGYLYTAEQIASLFLDSTHPVYQIKIKDDITKYYSTGKKDSDLKIVLLVDNTSASASEVLTSALKEQLDATVVGKTTYGKGTVQELQTLSDGNQYKVTTKQWLTSKGKNIHGKGIEPDIIVDLDDKYYDNPTIENDSQLQKAIEAAKNK